MTEPAEPTEVLPAPLPAWSLCAALEQREREARALPAEQRPAAWRELLADALARSALIADAADEAYGSETYGPTAAYRWFRECQRAGCVVRGVLRELRATREDISEAEAEELRTTLVRLEQAFWLHRDAAAAADAAPEEQPEPPASRGDDSLAGSDGTAPSPPPEPDATTGAAGPPEDGGADAAATC